MFIEPALTHERVQRALCSARAPDDRRRTVALAGFARGVKRRNAHKDNWPRQQLLEQHALCRPGGYGGAAAPDPIPNSAVKRSSADGTSSQDAGE